MSKKSTKSAHKAIVKKHGTVSTQELIDRGILTMDEMEYGPVRYSRIPFPDDEDTGSISDDEQ